MPAPAFAVMRGTQQPIDQTRVGVRPRIGDKGVHFIRRGREPQQVERRSANQSSPVGLDRRGDSVGLKLVKDIPVQAAAGPGRVGDRGLSRAGDGLVRPMGLALLVKLLLAGQCGRTIAGTGRPGQAHLDPGDKRFELVGRQWIVGRHFDFAPPSDRGDQRAVVRFARHGGGPAIDAGQHEGAPVQPQAAFLRFRRMALVTSPGENRMHSRLEEFFLLLLLLRSLLRRRLRAILLGNFVRSSDGSADDP